MVSLSSPKKFLCAAGHLRVICTLHITVNSSFLKDEKDPRRKRKENGVNSNNNYIIITLATRSTTLQECSEVRRLLQIEEVDFC